MYFLLLTVGLLLLVVGTRTKLTFNEVSENIEAPFGSSKMCNYPFSCPHQNMSYYVINREDVKNPYIIRDTDDGNVISKAPLVRGQPLKVISPGFDGNIFSANTLVNFLVPAYLKETDVNLIVVVYPNDPESAGWYCSTFMTPNLGECLAKFLLRLHKYIPEVTFENTHLIGSSYGGLIVSHAGNYLDGRISRLTNSPADERSVHTQDSPHPLNRNAAKFVDAYHTNMGYLGYWSMSGTVDVIINSGITQPGIGIGSYGRGMSYHVRPIELFMLSILYNRTLLAKRCKYSGYEYLADMSDHVCPLTEDETYHIVGEHISTNLEGRFLVCTSGSFPYSLGEYGEVTEQCMIQKS